MWSWGAECIGPLPANDAGRENAAGPCKFGVLVCGINEKPDGLENEDEVADGGIGLIWDGMKCVGLEGCKGRDDIGKDEWAAEGAPEYDEYERAISAGGVSGFELDEPSDDGDDDEREGKEAAAWVDDCADWDEADGDEEEAEGPEEEYVEACGVGYEDASGGAEYEEAAEADWDDVAEAEVAGADCSEPADKDFEYDGDSGGVA